jgi:hypothetical protein
LLRQNGGIVVGQICFFEAEDNWLEGDEFAVCIAQLPRASIGQIQTNADRSNHVATVTKILSAGGNSGLSATLKNGTPSVLLCPEYAFGLGDFAVMDGAIRDWSSPLILICGFGAVEGDVLNDWLADNSGATTKMAGWTQHGGPATQRTYNGGWVWIHLPGVSTRCIVFLKNFPEARHEVCLLERFDVGRDIVAIRCNDLVIFPQICADLICATNACPVDRLRALAHPDVGAGCRHALALNLDGLAGPASGLPLAVFSRPKTAGPLAAPIRTIRVVAVRPNQLELGASARRAPVEAR